MTLLVLYPGYGVGSPVVYVHSLAPDCRTYVVPEPRNVLRLDLPNNILIIPPPKTTIEVECQ